MNLYLYLTEPEWASAWIDGGNVPFYVASTYKSDERSGTMTPDENLIDSSTFDVVEKAPMAKFYGDHRGVLVTNCNFGAGIINGTIDRHYEDGLVICTATKRSRYIAKRLGKKACVKINDISKLKRLVDEQTGVKGITGLCKYTSSHVRHHFLKSSDDDWQREYRLFWKGVTNIKVDIPPGMAELEFILP